MLGRRHPGRSAIGLLRLLLAASLLVPTSLFALASWLNYRAAFDDARTDLMRVSEVVHQHAAKVFDSQSQVADRVKDLVRGMDVAAIRRSELPLHESFARIVGGLPQVQSVLLVARDGTPLVSAGTYPVPADVDLKNRDYFKAVIGGYRGTYVSSLQFGDVNRQLFFGLAQPWTDAAGATMGVIDVAVLPSFFRDFYRVLLGEATGGAEGNVVTLIRDDGQVLVRYPPFDGPTPVAPRDSPFFKAVAAHPDQGLYESHSIIDAAAPARVFAYEKVAGYPVYAVAGRSREIIIKAWRRTMASHLVFGLPAMLALFLVTWTALVRTRREEQALRMARQEMERRRRAEDALLRAQRLEAVGQMTGGIAHDFNNLLTVMLSGAEMLGRRAEDPVRVRNIAEQIMVAARRGGEITQKLLAFSRRQFVKAETIDLSARLREFRELLDRAASEAVVLSLDLAPDPALVRLDPGHFESAILNLVGNARDAMPQGGSITITTRNVMIAGHGELSPGPYVRVAVTDTGLGMGPETAAKAFEPFFTTKDVGRGTGLGLSQVYGFAKQSGGDVHLVTAPGQGTMVELLLPRVPGEALMERPPAESSPASRSGDGEVVLVVEDEPGLLAMTVESLRDLGYKPLPAVDAKEGLAHVRAGKHIDVLFSDVVMPGLMNGVQLATEARRLRPDLKVLLASGYAAGLASGTTHPFPLLPKPYDRGQLARSLHAVLRG